GAVICLECGYDLRIGKKRKTRVKRMERDWTPPPSLGSRVALLVVIVMLVGVICFSLLMGNVHPVPLALVWLGVTGLTTLLAGWYHPLHLTRDRQGALLLTKRSHLFFVPAGATTVDLNQCEAVQIDAGDPGTSGVSASGWEILGNVFLVLMFGWIG